ncbi:unnamed protein product [Schistosoma curassoni]|uniref:Secreted protein n=1 Tax=Schistosoma curassoni TaxID=6186 RepID=A0A183L3U2_9TREM|nr:unnamed protein product [Schistosoma curassoni]
MIIQPWRMNQKFQMMNSSQNSVIMILLLLVPEVIRSAVVDLSIKTIALKRKSAVIVIVVVIIMIMRNQITKASLKENIVTENH